MATDEERRKNKAREVRRIVSAKGKSDYMLCVDCDDYFGKYKPGRPKVYEYTTRPENKVCPYCQGGNILEVK